MSLQFWKKEPVKAQMFFGVEHNFGRQVLEDELRKANCDPDKIDGIVDFVSAMLVAQTNDVLNEVKKMDIV